MSDMGASQNPDLGLAVEITKTQQLNPLDKTNVMQWPTDEGGIMQKYASRQNASNLWVKFSPP